jgi:hypothetical protein
MIFDDPHRAVKRAIMVAKGLGRAIGPLPGDRAPYSAAMPMLAGGGAVGQHPASMLPGVHVSGSPMGFAAGGDVEPANETGFDAWHGTPHEFPAERLIQHPTGAQEHVLASRPVPESASVLKDFPLGRFRSDKIGTGEGAQAYGHGLYVAQNKATAESYKKNTTDAADRKVYNEKATWLNNEGRNLDKDVLKEKIEEMQKEYKRITSRRGHLYHVRVNANPEHFLDWDKPLSEQHSTVQHVARTANVGVEATGKDLHRALSSYGENSPSAAAVLQEAGIPGIRYLDANSRGPTGNPTHNHVIFDPSIIDIKHRYKRGGEVVNTQKNPVLHHAMSLTNPGKYATNAVNITKTLLKRP